MTAAMTTARILLLCGAGTTLLAPRVHLRATRTAPGASVVGLYGDWESAEGGSYLLEPPEGEAKGVVHFVGGAFIGAASQLTYRYLLERFAGSGYLVVATPFRLSFDYLSVCDAVEASYEAAAAEARRRGYDDALFDDVVGVGHSCGALLQALIATRRPGERRRLALMSYNNKGAASAIPNFEDLVTPIAVELAGDDRSPLTPLLRQAVGTLRGAAEEALDAAEAEDAANPFMRLRAAAPPGLRTFGDAFVAEAGAVARQGLEVADQLPDLLGEIAAGAREFDPTPRETRELLRDAFRADDVLVLQFDDDDIDESDEIYAVLRDAAEQKRKTADAVDLVAAPGGAWAASEDLPGGAPRAGAATARPSTAPLAVRLARVKGTHLTPLTQDIFLPASKVADYAATATAVDPLIAAPRGTFLRQVDDAFAELDAWLAGTEAAK